MMLNYIKPEATGDFEAVMDKLGEALNSSENPERGRQAQGWKIYKAQEAGPNNSVLYVWFIDPTHSECRLRRLADIERGLPDRGAGRFTRASVRRSPVASRWSTSTSSPTSRSRVPPGMAGPFVTRHRRGWPRRAFPWCVRPRVEPPAGGFSPIIRPTSRPASAW